MKKLTALTIAIVFLAACEANEPDVKPDPATTETTSSTTAAEADTTAGAEVPAELEGRFGGMVFGATTVTVTQRDADGEIDFAGQERVADAAWIERFITAIGPKAPGSEAVPRCLPIYQFTFSNADGELAQFGGVCAGMEGFILIKGGSSYSAEDDAAARALLKELAAKQPAAE
jgi:hypothetical protein